MWFCTKKENYVNSYNIIIITGIFELYLDSNIRCNSKTLMDFYVLDFRLSFPWSALLKRNCKTNLKMTSKNCYLIRQYISGKFLKRAKLFPKIFFVPQIMNVLVWNTHTLPILSKPAQQFKKHYMDFMICWQMTTFWWTACNIENSHPRFQV